MTLDREVIIKTVEEYHERFYPEVIVELLEIKGEKLTFRFEGHFCYTCGVSDYFDDFALFLTKNLGKEYIVKNKEKFGGEEDPYWIVTFSTKDKVKSEELDDQKIQYVILDPDTGEPVQEIDV